jgi:hypothetical protein
VQSSPEAGVLVEALLLCLTRSRVAQRLGSAPLLRSLAEKALGEPGAGEVQLEPVWTLFRERGVAGKDLAQPLLLFKSCEGELGVPIKLPTALASLPAVERARLCGTATTDVDDLRRRVAGISGLVHVEDRDRGMALKPFAPAVARPPRRLPSGLVVAVAAAAVVALVAGLWLTFRDSSTGLDTADVSSLLQLQDGRRAGESVTARIVDPRWDTLPRDEQQRLAGQVFDRLVRAGARAMTLSDGAGTRVIATDAPGSRQVIIR